jgi:predicted metal-binding membrane protein
MPTRDLVAVWSGLAVIVGAGWLYLAIEAPRTMSGGGTGMRMGAMSAVQPWTTSTFLVAFAMWSAMMVAMMVPSAAPMVLVHAAVSRKASSQGSPIPRTAIFVAGYVLVWTLFSVAAAAAQGGLGRAALLSPQMSSNSSLLAGALLLAAGIYQLTPAKNRCLENCRAPAHFLSRHWRPGVLGSLRMGVLHGLYCLGCCWVLMALLFVGGVMNLLWVAAIAVFVLLEKASPLGVPGGRVLGGAMAGAGLLALGGIVSLT